MPTLALCMIVKNAAETIRACLESVAGIVDQIVIADTGCTDTTCEIAREFGATILDAPWQDHFAEARNQAIAGATTDWVLVLDGDEELGAEAGASMARLLAAEGVGGYLVPIHEYLPFVSGSAWTATILPNRSDHERARNAPSYMVNTLCRLFVRRPDIYFTGRVHEMVQPQIQAAGLAIQAAPFRIHHYGHLAQAEATARKRAFYNDLLQKKLADDGDDVTTLTMCGLDEWEVYRRPLEALRYFQRALELNPNVFETWLLTARVLCAVERYEEALASLDVVRNVEKDTYLQLRLRGDALLGLRRLEEARAAYEGALASCEGNRIVEAKIDYIDIELERGDREAALIRLKLAAESLPGDIDIHYLLVNACISMGRLTEAATEAERFSRLDKREPLLLRAATLRAQLQEWDGAELLARQCALLYPDSAGAHELLMMALVAQARLVEAGGEAEKVALLGDEPRAYLRAAGIYAQLGDSNSAVACVERGLQRFPDSWQLKEPLAQNQLNRSRAHTPVAM